ncbi:MAG: hypothetical protein PWP10_3729 [Clostridiales bacterium]|jgi:hypothetical protein|nr:hypothetical protein [Clostridiales bacterium]
MAVLRLFLAEKRPGFESGSELCCCFRSRRVTNDSRKQQHLCDCSVRLSDYVGLRAETMSEHLRIGGFREVYCMG